MTHSFKYLPKDPALQGHIDHYWIVKDVEALFGSVSSVTAYPGITPELIIPLEGEVILEFGDQHLHFANSTMFSHIHQPVVMQTSKTALRGFVIVQFKSAGLASLQNFTKPTAKQLMKNPIEKAELVFGKDMQWLEQKIKMMEADGIVDELDQYFYQKFQPEREGFVAENFINMQDVYNESVLKHTVYSYSTLERYFKKEVGLTPKKFLTLKRYKTVVREIYKTLNTDWSYYVHKFGYHDQSHMIKEIKRYTAYTPRQLLMTPGLITFRPQQIC